MWQVHLATTNPAATNLPRILFLPNRNILDQSIQKIFYSTLKTEALSLTLVDASSTWHLFTLIHARSKNVLGYSCYRRIRSLEPALQPIFARTNGVFTPIAFVKVKTRNFRGYRADVSAEKTTTSQVNLCYSEYSSSQTNLVLLKRFWNLCNAQRAANWGVYSYIRSTPNLSRLVIAR